MRVTQSVQRQLVVFLLVPFAMIFRAEFVAGQALKHRQFRAAMQTPHEY
jgi:hypothetical protein